MSVPRFHVDFVLSEGARVGLPETVSHHAIRVLRLQNGAPIVLFNGQGGAWRASLAIEGKRGWAEVTDFIPDEAELPGRITLVQGIASGDKMDWVIEKAVELGAHAIAPIAAHRSVLRLSGERLHKRVMHWRRVAISACEQCGRNRIPEVAAPSTLSDWLATSAAHHELVLLCHPESTHTLAERLKAAPAPRSLALLVGPEGGWSDEELHAARSSAVVAVRFGRRVLRTETAGLALIAAASALLGWLD